MQAVKFKDGSRDIIEGLLAPYGGPEFLGGRDLDGEFFSPDTDFELEWFGDWERPVLFGHGTDPALKTSVVGRMKVTPTELGLWAEAKLDEAHAYKEAIASLVDRGALGWSGGSIERFYAAGLEPQTGHIKHFPLIEGSLVTMPSNPFAILRYAAKSTDIREHLAVLGVAMPAAVEDEQAEIPIEAPDDSEESVEPASEDTPLDAIKSVLTPQALHDAAVASGAVCAEGKTPSEPPVPVLAVAGKGAEKSAPFDPEAFRREIQALAAEAVRTALS